MALPPTTGLPLDLYVPAYGYGVNPGDDTYDIPENDNATIINTWAAGVVLLAPSGTQTIVQPANTYFNVNNPQIYGATPTVRFGVNASVWDSAISRTSAGVFTFDTDVMGNAAGTVKAAIVNAGTGFQVNGAAPSGHILVGNGTEYVDSSTLPPLAGIYYQTIQSAGTPETQRPVLNFLARFAVADDSGNTSTDVDLAVSGVTADSYTNASITVDTYGRVTAASDGVPITGTTVNDVTGSRSTGVTYQNTSGYAMWASGSIGTPTGSSTGNLQCSIGPTSGLGLDVYTQDATATVNSGQVGFMFVMIPVNFYYRIDVTGAVSGVAKWIEGLYK